MILLLTGMLLGFALAIFIIWNILSSNFVREQKSKYDLAKTTETLQQKLTEAGWKIPVIHDLQLTMHNNGYEVLPVKVFEICKPIFANHILQNSTRRYLSTMMPCRISVYEKHDGSVYLAMMNSSLFSRILHHDAARIIQQAFNETSLIINDITNK